MTRQPCRADCRFSGKVKARECPGGVRGPGAWSAENNTKDADMASMTPTADTSATFQPVCPRCGGQPALATQLPTRGDVAEWFYSCPSDHAWLVKWATI